MKAFIRSSCMFLLILSLINSSSVAQVFSETINVGGNGFDFCSRVEYDNNGNKIIAGTFSGNVDFDPGMNTNTLSATGGSDPFVLKLDSLGNFIWAVTYGGYGNNDLNDIAIDKDNSIYLTGFFSDSIDLDPDTSENYFRSNGSKDSYILKLDENGIFKFGYAFGGSKEDIGRSISCDVEKFVLSGTFRDTVDFDPDTSFSISSSRGSSDIFHIVFDLEGNYLKSFNHGSNSLDVIYDVSYKKGAIYSTGVYLDSTDLSPHGVPLIYQSKGKTDCFISKHDDSGNIQWGYTFGDVGADESRSLFVNNNGFLGITGKFENNVDFDPGTSNFQLNSKGLSDCFTSVFDTNGVFKWARSIGGTSVDLSSSINIDEQNNIYITGQFRDSIDADPGDDNYYIFSQGIYDGFLQALNEDGDFYFAQHFKGISNVVGYTVTSRQNSIMIGGIFEGSLSVQSENVNLASNGSFDVFILDINRDMITGESIKYKKSNLTYNVYPNPFNNSLIINSSEMISGIEVYSSNGKLALSKSGLNSKEIHLNSNEFDLYSPWYIIKITVDSEVYFERIIHAE